MATRSVAAPKRPNPFAGLAGPAREVGEIAGFSARGVAAIPGSMRYTSEVLRQIGTLVTGSAVILLAMQAVIGGECGLFLVYLLRPLGATSAVGQVQVPCSLRELFPYMFGYIFAAKVGCGLVAEIGSMRISAEIDALESVGIDGMKYVIGTRLIAIMVFVPLIYIASLATGLIGGYLVTTVQLKGLSGAQYLNGYFSSQSLGDNIDSIIKALCIGWTIAFVSLYYGYKARGGPVGVGNAVARSMIVNLVMIHVIAAFFSAVFWGTHAGYPEGG